MTNNKDLFKDPNISCTLKVGVGDDKCITVSEKRTITISTNKGTKLISDVLYFLEFD